MKKNALLVSILTTALLGGCGSASTYEAPTPIQVTETVEEPAAQVEEFVEESTPEEETSADKEELKKAFNEAIGDDSPAFYESIHNDVTGTWREMVIYSDKVIDAPLTVDYVNAYYGADEEVHFIVNLYLKTTTVINKIGDVAYVYCHEYQDKEETDANLIGGGMMLDEFSVDLTTGQLIDDGSSENAESTTSTYSSDETNTYSEMGRDAGEQLEDWLDSIDWDGTQEDAEQAGRDAADFINSIIDN